MNPVIKWQNIITVIIDIELIQKVVVEAEEEKEVEKEIIAQENIVEVIVENIDEVIQGMMIIEKDTINQKVQGVFRNLIRNFVVWKMV